MMMPPIRGYATSPQGEFSDPEEDAMLRKLYADMPEFRKRQRRAKALRKSRDSLQSMADKELSLGGVSPGSHGGLYSISGSYIPNYAGMAEKAVGALGGLYADRKGGQLEEAEGAADELQSEKLLEDALILGRRARARRKGAYRTPGTY